MREKIIQLLEYGMISRVEIAKKLKCSYSTVCYHIKTMGIALPRSIKSTPIHAARDEKIFAMRVKGFSMGQIAKKVGLTRQRVEQILAKGRLGGVTYNLHECPICKGVFATRSKRQRRSPYFCSLECRRLYKALKPKPMGRRPEQLLDDIPLYDFPLGKKKRDEISSKALGKIHKFWLENMP